MTDDGFSIEIEGLSALQAKMEDLSTKQSEAAIRKALRAGAAIEQAAIIERAPVKVEGRGGEYPAGALQNDIVVTTSRATDGTIIAIVGPDQYTKRLAGWVEYGHRMVTGGRSRVGKNGKARGPGKVHDESVPAYPFIRPAFEATQAEVAQTMCDVLAKEIESASAKNG
jgi:HK97 gp10 family phage protein